MRHNFYLYFLYFTPSKYEHHRIIVHATVNPRKINSYYWFKVTLPYTMYFIRTLPFFCSDALSVPVIHT